MKKRGETIKSTAWLIKPLLHPPLHPRFQNPPKDIHSCLYSIYPIYSIRNAEFSFSFFFLFFWGGERGKERDSPLWMRLMRMNHGRIDTFPFRDIVIRIDAWSNLTILPPPSPLPALLSIRESSLWAWIPDPSIPGIDQKPICDMTSGKLELFHRAFVYIDTKFPKFETFDRSVPKVTSFPLRIKERFFRLFFSSFFFPLLRSSLFYLRSETGPDLGISIDEFPSFFRLTLFSPSRFSRRVGETRLCNSCARSRLPR